MDLWVRGNANVFACHAVITSTTHLPTCAKSNPTLLHEANKAATDPQELEEAGFEALEPFRVQGFAGVQGVVKSRKGAAFRGSVYTGTTARVYGFWGVRL